MNKMRATDFLMAAIIFIAAVVLAVYSWNVLPMMVATQPAAFDTGAPDVHKLVAVGLPTALMMVFAFLGSRERKAYLGCLIGVGLHVLFWLCN